MSEIKMVSNSARNHLSELKDLFQIKANRLIIASPYLASDLKGLLSEFSFDNVESIELVTTFKPDDIDQISKPFLLRDYFQYFKERYPKINLKLHVDNRLHGKIFVSTHDSNHVAILGSANFTRNGLCNNHEWGVLINDNQVIAEIIDDLYSSLEYEDVTYNQISKACLFADQYGKEYPEWKKKPEISSDILKNVCSVESSTNTIPQYFLKPIGDTESPVLLEDQSDYSELNQDLHFSKKKPSGVKKGDVLITIAVGGGALLSYFKVTAEPKRVSDHDMIAEPWKKRWPWYVEGRNQAPEFAAQWWTHNIQRNDVLADFLDEYPKVPVTYAGNFTLGALNFGSDKLRITKDFGDYLISKIEASV